MSTKRKDKVEFGDFQTPDLLCRRVCQLLVQQGFTPKTIVEPTCGRGAFLRASVDAFPECRLSLGFEINPDYAREAGTVGGARVYCEDFFEKDWSKVFKELPPPILVVGNPPWVTNSVVGALGGTNLPYKSNFQHFKGFDAITGKSNFDISEWMLLQMLEGLSGRSATLAMLCKTIVARKVLQYAWRKHLQVNHSAIYLINALEHFEASVDACLLVCTLGPGTASQECSVYSSLDASAPTSVFGFRNGRLVGDLVAAATYDHLYGTSPVKWRSGVKHDCSRVMELRATGSDTFRNGFGEVVYLENDFLYPMLKSSELLKPYPTSSRHMLVTQRYVGEDTSRIRREAPCTWSYLESHGSELDNRSSSIYRDRPRFSVFGVGPYTFAPWKVAISGFYKRLHFRVIGPVDSKPVVLDDTCYFVPCHTEGDAKILVDLLNCEAAKGFFESLVFWDAKRPITVNLLGSLDLDALATNLGVVLPLYDDDRRQLKLL